MQILKCNGVKSITIRGLIFVVIEIKMLSSALNTFLYVFTSLITVVNPICAAMFFLAMTSKVTRQERMMLSNRVAVYCFIMATVSLYAGSFVLSFFGISIGVLRVAGGLVLFSAGWLSLNNNTANEEEASEVSVRPKSKGDLLKMAFYPFTLPLTIGPGAIAVTTAIGTSMKLTLPNVVGATSAALATAIVIWLCFRYSDRITAALGATGSDAIGRVFSFILICLGVQIFWVGFSDLWLALMAQAK